MLKNTDNSYGLITKIFHWLIALAVLGLITVGFTMASMDSSAEKSELYTMHRASGTMILILVVLRLAWKFSNNTVKPPKIYPIF